MKWNYGYTDGRGEFYLTVDTDKCTGCGDCVEACPQGILEVALNDFDQEVVQVKETLRKQLSYKCLGYYAVCSKQEKNCHSVCPTDVITHTW
ncbi:MAG: hypothetical protein A3G93_11115 [Nitrospinae bacterium RIFCSPLOWO2_12_FULL_45_22]|nr:MAG: hypothetical protein A3G93_11115 [Nitrospinae bacterium RIFCSPLOWO2_12_FULL_45_22]